MSALVQATGLDPHVADALHDELIQGGKVDNPRKLPFYRLPGTSKKDQVLQQYIEVHSNVR